MHKSIITEQNANSKVVIATAMASGLLASLVITNVSRLFHAWNSLWGLAIAPVGIVLGAIVPGVIIHAALDFHLRHFDRNLFPFEIVMWWIVAPLPLMGGIAIARLIKLWHRPG